MGAKSWAVRDHSLSFSPQRWLEHGIGAGAGGETAGSGLFPMNAKRARVHGVLYAFTESPSV
jgi:hypothetical protein